MRQKERKGGDDSFLSVIFMFLLELNECDMQYSLISCTQIISHVFSLMGRRSEEGQTDWQWRAKGGLRRSRAVPERCGVC